MHTHLFLGPRGPLVLPSVGSSVPSRLQEKSGSLIYRHICLMNANEAETRDRGSRQGIKIIGKIKIT